MVFILFGLVVLASERLLPSGLLLTLFRCNKHKLLLRLRQFIQAHIRQ
jgi:hypothetical protein